MLKLVGTDIALVHSERQPFMEVGCIAPATLLRTLSRQVRGLAQRNGSPCQPPSGIPEPNQLREVHLSERRLPLFTTC